MPFLSLLTNPFTNLGIAGKSLYGVSVPRTYSFVNAPTSIGEKNLGNNDQYKDIDVNTINVDPGTVLYWTILHQTTSNADFLATNGSFTSNSLGNELGRFRIQTIKDATTEGSETFQIQIREQSITGEVVLTSPPITIEDTSLTPAYAFGTMPTSINEAAFTIGFPVLTTNVDDGTVLYWTINTSAAVTSADFSSLSGSVTIYSNRATFGLGTTNDLTTEGPETFTLSLRTNSITGPVVATSTSITINDTSTFQAPITNTFQYQIMGGGGPVGTHDGANFSAGGGGAGGFVPGTVLWTDRTKDSITWSIQVGAAGNLSSIYSSIFSFYAYGGGRGAGSNHAASSGGSGGGGSAGGGGSVYNVGGAGTTIGTVKQGNAGGKAWSFGYSNVGGGGGGYSGVGTPGGAGYSGNGGAGTTDWTGTYVCYGGGGKSAANITGASGSPGGSAPANSGGGGGGVTGTSQPLGGSGKVIIRYPETYRAPVFVVGNPSTYISGGYRYYVWTTSGTIKFAD